MKLPLTAALATALFFPSTTAETTNSAGCSLSNGNWYCRQTNAITYTNFGLPGSYKAVSSMDSTTGTCKFTQQSFGGGMAPLDGEVSWHFRGPLRLKQFAFYTLGSSNDGPVVKQAKTKRRSGRLHHRHWQLHEKRPDPERPAVDEGVTLGPVIEQRALGEWVTVTMDGKVVSWQNSYGGQAAGGSPATLAPAAAPSTAPPKAGGNAPPPQNSNAASQGQRPDSNTSPSSPQQTNSPPSNPSSPPSNPAGSWRRQGYYNAATGTSTGLAFLANLGASSCSGTWDTHFGNSLSYVSSDGKTCSPSSVPLADTLLPDNTEITLFTSTPCSASAPCSAGGISRPQSVAHHGFAGASKLFLLEFSMPLSSSSQTPRSGSGSGGSGRRSRRGLNDDMPAAWLLNAAVSRTAQYGSCSCWASGCGELDVFEVLTPGEARAKSAWHGRNALGDSAWFARPTGKMQKAAVLLDGEAGSARIVYLDDDDGAEFAGALSAAQVGAWLRTGESGVLVKLPAMRET